jgi:hypothetical protein
MRRAVLFILGLPRSGTTLTYQYIVHRLQVAYFTNGVGHYYRSPCVATFLQTRWYGPYSSDFRSEYGKVEGPIGPREAGSFWGRFFDLNKYSRFEDVISADMDKMRNTIACIQRIFHDSPFVNKNVKHMLRLHALSRIFPEAVFLVVLRDLADVAISIFRARRSRAEGSTAWWSVRPRDFAGLENLPVVEQVAQQVVRLDRQLRAEIRTLPESRVLFLQYERFCETPEELIGRVRSAIGPVEDNNPPQASFRTMTHEAADEDEQWLLERVRTLATV